MAEGGKVTIVTREFNPTTKQFDEKSHEVAADNLTTVLGALIGIKEREDPEISFRYSCRMGICGSCAMVVNGKPKLACEALVVNEGTGPITVEPMRGQPLLKGLVTDFDDFFEKHKSIHPWLIRSNPKDRFDNAKEMHQTDEQRDYFLPFAECIKCGLCIDACPVENTNKNFLGPQALAQAYRYYADSKDQGGAKRLEQLDTLNAAWGCEFSGSCSKACPKSVDPALAIQLLKADIAKYNLTGKVKGKE